MDLVEGGQSWFLLVLFSSRNEDSIRDIRKDSILASKKRLVCWALPIKKSLSKQDDFELY